MSIKADRISELLSEISSRVFELQSLIGPERVVELIPVKHIVARECSRAYNEEVKREQP